MEEMQSSEAIRVPGIGGGIGSGIGWQGARQVLTVDVISAHPAFHRYLREQSGLLVQAYESNPQRATVFATQPRWLMAHAAFSLYFRASGAGEGLNAARFVELVSLHDVASRDTASAFLKEMLKHGYARQVPAVADRRRRPLEPTRESIDAVHGWVAVHLATLDKLDGGHRVATFLANPGALATLQPLIADGLLSAAGVRAAEETSRLSAGSVGSVVVEWLIAGIGEIEPGAERIPTAVVSAAEMAGWLKLSATHLAHKLAVAEKMGSIGWLGKRGQSVMWISDGFHREYTRAQAAKLAVIDAAFATCHLPGDAANDSEPEERAAD
ncbi:MAG: hypothetical protein PSV46_02715 [Reyranella sp.]|nr:hypothetical protein [Reyranella sp.]